METSERDYSEDVTLSLLNVIEERRRQVTVEGWHPEDDDQLPPGVLSRMGAAYASLAADGLDAGDDFSLEVYRNQLPPAGWPIDRDRWKPSHPIRDLTKGAALLLAELERFDRVAMARAKEELNERP